MLGATTNKSFAKSSRTETSVAVDRIKRALDEALALADLQGFAIVARRIAAAKVEILLTDLEGSKDRAMASLNSARNRTTSEARAAKTVIEKRVVSA